MWILQCCEKARRTMNGAFGGGCRAEMMHWLSSNRGLVGLNIKVESGRPVEIGVASETTRLFWAPGSEQEFKQLLGQWLESSDFEKVVFFFVFTTDYSD